MSYCSPPAIPPEVSTLPVEQRLMESAASAAALRAAAARVRLNQGAPGVDGVSVDELIPWLDQHGGTLQLRLVEGRYAPQPLRRVELPKPGGGVRVLGIPTAFDRVVQQALLQVLSPVWEPNFSERSFAFRPRRSAHDALRCAVAEVAAGRDWLVHLDLEKFFDRVPHGLLLERLARRVSDPRVLDLVEKFIRAPFAERGRNEARPAGIPQGGPLSPLLANVMLDDFDHELAARGLPFVRYADDITLFAKSEAEGTALMRDLSRWLEEELNLPVNRRKCAVARPWERTVLGFLVAGHPGGPPVPSPEALEELEARLEGLSPAEAAAVRRGWESYFAPTLAPDGPAPRRPFDTTPPTMKPAPLPPFENQGPAVRTKRRFSVLGWIAARCQRVIELARLARDISREHWRSGWFGAAALVTMTIAEEVQAGLRRGVTWRRRGQAVTSSMVCLLMLAWCTCRRRREPRGR